MAHGLLIIATLLALLALPCVLALVIFVDVAFDWCERVISAGTDWWRARRLERRTGMRGHRSAPAAPAGPPFERLAADLRRLARQRVQVGHRSPVWFNAVHRAYDDHLALACRELEIPEQLHELDGIDLELERMRVESRLEAAGLHISIDTDHWQDSQ